MPLLSTILLEVPVPASREEASKTVASAIGADRERTKASRKQPEGAEGLTHRIIRLLETCYANVPAERRKDEIKFVLTKVATLSGSFSMFAGHPLSCRPNRENRRKPPEAIPIKNRGPTSPRNWGPFYLQDGGSPEHGGRMACCGYPNPLDGLLEQFIGPINACSLLAISASKGLVPAAAA